MTKAYVVAGKTEDPTRVWLVYWSLDRADCQKIVDVCNAERDALLNELTPIWNQMERIQMPKEYGWRGGRRNRSYESELNVYEAARDELEAREHEVNKRHAASMFDALFPTGNDGWLPDVEYVIWSVAEGMRDEFTTAELITMRAKLHAVEEADALPEDESD